MHERPEIETTGARPTPRTGPQTRYVKGLLRLCQFLALVAVCAGVFLHFHRLAWNGSTWDEIADFRIARNFVQKGSILLDKSDPSQARLPHILGALSIAALGETLWAFKLPFAVAGLFAGGLLCAFVAVRYGGETALYTLAFYLTNPWVLSSSRSAATAGDILVILTTFAFLWAAIRVFGEGDIPRHPFWRTACLGLLAGLSVGAKLTNAVLLPAGLALVALRRKSLVHLLAFAGVAALATIAVHPLLITHTRSTLGATAQAFGMTWLAMEGVYTHPDSPVAAAVADADRVLFAVEPLEVENTPKVRYLHHLLVGKLTLPFLLFVAAGIGLGLHEAWRTRQLNPTFWGPLAFFLAPCVVLIWKYRQNANYYVQLLIPAITIAAIPLARWLRSEIAWRRLLVAFAWLAIVGFQLWLDVHLAPDYLQAGRRLGAVAQGQMAGPATNHCQGTPVLIETLNRLRQEGERFDTVGVFETCLMVMIHDAAFGPVAPEGYRFGRYNPKAPPRDEHVFVVHDVIHSNQFGMPEHTSRMRLLERAKAGCTWLNANSPNDRFKIYRCAGRG